MTRRCPRNDAIRFSGSAEEPSDLSDILSLTSEEETLTSCTSSLSVVTSSWDDTVLGNNTTRTSSYSLREDKFDREASSDVRQMFEAIDCELYGDSFVGCPSSSSHHRAAGRVVGQRLKRGFRGEDEDEPEWSPRGSGSGQRQQRECIGEWKNTFPHMRICGISLTGASDEGFQVYPTIGEETPPRTSTTVTTSADSRRRSNAGLNGLKITGRNVDTISMTLPNTAAERRRRSISGEEIFESDGNLEEIIAIDYRNVEEMGQRLAGDGLQRTGGIPPITPLACVRSSLIDSVFDVTWQQIVSELRPFLRKHCHLDSDRIDNSVSRLMHQVMMAGGGGAAAAAAASRFRSPPDRHSSRSPPPPPPHPHLHESSPARSISTPEKPPSRHSARERNQLTDLLRINRKTLLTRDKIDANLLPSPPHPHSASSSSASAASASSSSILFVHLPGDSSRMTDHLLSPGRHRYGARDRLEVIHDDDDHVPPVAITTTIQIRGQRLHGSGKIDPLSSLSILPPINPELSRLSSSSRAPNRRFHYRVTSALAPKTGRLFPAERPAAIPQSRPVTESGLYHRVDVANTRPNGRRHSATHNTSNNNMRNLLKTMMDASNAQPQVKGIGLQRYHTVIS